MALNALGEKDREGKEVFVIEDALASGGSLAITPGTHGFAVIDSVQASIKKSTAPTTRALSWEESSGTVTIYGWKATASGDTALIASDAEETVNVMIIGRRR